MTVTAEPAGTARFPKFDLARLVESTCAPAEGERVCILIDLPDPAQMHDFAFLRDPALTSQRLAHDVFFRGLAAGVLEQLGLAGGEIYAYRTTAGSNLDLPDTVVDPAGRTLPFVDAICRGYDIVYCIATYSATAPLLALARQHGFRGFSLHGIDEHIVNTGLCVDYRAVGEATEQLRAGISGSHEAEIRFEVGGEAYTLHMDLAGGRAGKSCGQCRDGQPNIENLPDGEVYFFPVGASGSFPLPFEEDGTIGRMDVVDGRIVDGALISGNPATLERTLAKFRDEPAASVVCELGFGTQRFPYSGRGIQDEKMLGTLHVATGRCDHLGGPIGPDSFKDPSNATHDDHLFGLERTPAIDVPQVTITRDGHTETLIEHYRPSPFFLSLLDGPGGG